MAGKQAKNEEFFDSIAPKVQSSPIIITTKDQIKKTAFGKLGGIFLILFLLALGGGLYLGKQYLAVKQELAGLQSQLPQAQQNASQESLLSRIGQHFLLPLGEQPAVVTVEDAAGLKQLQPLYVQVQNGDQLVTFSTMQIVYDPLADKILYVRALSPGEIATTTPAQSASQASSTPAAARPITLDIRNGSGTAGAASQVAQALGKEATYKILSIGNAQKSNYTGTVIVNLTGRDVSNLEIRFNTKATVKLPPGETSSSADVVLIIGR